MYQALIRKVVPDLPAHHVEAWMRVNHPTLDGLDPTEFSAQARMAAAAADEAGPAMSEELARSYGITEDK